MYLERNEQLLFKGLLTFMNLWLTQWLSRVHSPLCRKALGATCLSPFSTKGDELRF